MPTLPPGRLTRQQIRDLACRRAGNTTVSGTDAVNWLGQLLYDLYTLYEWPFLNVSAALSLTGPTFALPTDYLKTQDDAGLRVLSIDGTLQAFEIAEHDRETFDIYAARVSQSVPPIWWTADRANGLGLLAPDPSGHTVAATLRYKRLPAEPASASEPTDVPVFPWHNYLVQALFVMVLQYESDGRVAQEAAMAEAMLAKIRGAAMPLRSQRPDIPLDPEVFSPPFRGDDRGWW